jgi:hypothetical protein
MLIKTTVTTNTLISYNNTYYSMPPRTANVTDDVYNDIQTEMSKTNRSYSYVVNRRLEKLMIIEGENKNV